MRRFASLVLLLALGTRSARTEPVPAPPPRDLFAQVLRDAGLWQGALGYRAKGTWNRFPDAPYKLPFFDDLLAEPTSTYEFVRTLGNVVEDWLTPARLREADPKKATALFRLGVALGTDRRIGGFRGPFGDGQYGANLDPKPAEKEPLVAALWAIRRENADETDLRTQVAAIPEALHLPLARLVLNLTSAREWIDRGLGEVPKDLRERLFDARGRLYESDGDGQQFHPVVEEIARRIDEHSLHYGCLKALQATQDARRELSAMRPKDGWPDVQLAWASRLGSITIARDFWFESEPPSQGGDLLLVRLGRTERLQDVGCTSIANPLSVALLLNGGGTGRTGLRANKGYRQACGVLGCGIVYVGGEGDSIYRGDTWTQGAGFFGMGVLIDEGGDDTYEADSLSQGAGMFGVGLLLDASGNDTYVLRKGDGQGFGGPNGIGVLADRSGNDSYYAEPDASKAGRADYHSAHKVAVSNAQGVGSGRRGDLTDGHAWAGGLGALIDVDGDDKYRAGNFSQGCGYWFGTGAIYDGGGNDEYRSVYFTQASGAHFAVGTIVDEGGDDVHVLEENAGAGLGFGWDVVNAILFDRAGNDRYEAKIISTGCAEVRSNGWLLDEEGDDVYLLDEGTLGFGAVDDLASYATPDRYAPFAFHIPQLGLLIDAGGTDRYLRRPSKGGDPVRDAHARDGAAWGNGAPKPRGAPNVARGLDAPSGRLGFLDPWPRRK